MIFVCVEPAHDNVTTKTDFYDWHFIIKPGLGHHIVFPHVDSCLGVACLLKSGKVFGGHINGFFEGDFSADSHKGAFDSMVEQLGDEEVKSAVVFGDVGNWEMMGVDMKARLKCNNITYLIYSSGEAVDVMVDVDSGDVSLMEWEEGRNFKTIPPGDVQRTVNLKSIEGSHRVRV